MSPSIYERIPLTTTVGKDTNQIMTMKFNKKDVWKAVTAIALTGLAYTALVSSGGRGGGAPRDMSTSLFKTNLGGRVVKNEEGITVSEEKFEAMLVQLALEEEGTTLEEMAKLTKKDMDEHHDEIVAEMNSSPGVTVVEKSGISPSASTCPIDINYQGLVLRLCANTNPRGGQVTARVSVGGIVLFNESFQFNVCGVNTIPIPTVRVPPEGTELLKFTLDARVEFCPRQRIHGLVTACGPEICPFPGFCIPRICTTQGPGWVNL